MASILFNHQVHLGTAPPNVDLESPSSGTLEDDNTITFVVARLHHCTQLFWALCATFNTNYNTVFVCSASHCTITYKHVLLLLSKSLSKRIALYQTHGCYTEQFWSLHYRLSFNQVKLKHLDDYTQTLTTAWSHDKLFDFNTFFLFGARSFTSFFLFCCLMFFHFNATVADEMQFNTW